MNKNSINLKTKYLEILEDSLLIQQLKKQFKRHHIKTLIRLLESLGESDH